MLLVTATERLRAAGCLTPRLDAELLLADVLGVGREALYREPERVLTTAEADRFGISVFRREQREPVAYILGRRAFRTIEVGVGPGVLVPRPETETLVEVGLAVLLGMHERRERDEVASGPGAGPEAAERWRTPQVLDLCTGSGSVALAIAAEHPEVHVVGVDDDPQALAWANQNAARLGLTDRVEFLGGDLYAALPPRALFDLILCNPPYLSEAEFNRVQAEVNVHEPSHALIGGADGLSYYERVVRGALPFLRPRATLAVEVHEGRAEDVAEVFRTNRRYRDVRIHHDLGGAPRVVSGRERA